MKEPRALNGRGTSALRGKRPAGAGKRTVFIVDNDEPVRRALVDLVESVGLVASAYCTGQAFLAAYRPPMAGCLVLDVRLPGMSGLEILERLAADGAALPTVVITGYAEVSTAVQAMKAGAVDFIEKPFSDQDLLDGIHRALELESQMRLRTRKRNDVAARLAGLTPREREVMSLVVAGTTNRDIAARLSIAAKTVEAHRANVMRKMGAGSLAELVRMALPLDSRAT